MLKRFFYRLEGFFARPHINWVKTLYLNFQLLPFEQAKKLPLFIYGKCQIVSTKGKVNITCPVKKGMIKIGRNTDKFFANQKTLVLINEGSTLTFNGPVTFGTGCTFRLTNRGSISFGEYIRCGSGTRFFSEDEMTIGRYTIIAYYCQLLNTNFHYTLDVNSNIVRRNTKPVIIGAFNWIGNRTTVMKGCKTKDYTIVTSGSLLNKDYIKLDESSTPVMLAGTPAKLMSTGYKRIFSLKMENSIRQFFRNNDEDVFNWEDGMQDTIEDTHVLF